MTTQTSLPAGTATGNTDAVRQGKIAQAFFLFADVLAGVDSQQRMEPGMTNSRAQLGPSSSYGVDVGIADDGSFYARGRSSNGQAADATPAHDAAAGTAATAAAGFTLPQIGPIGWLIVAAIAYKLLIK